MRSTEPKPEGFAIAVVVLLAPVLFALGLVWWLL